MIDIFSNNKPDTVNFYNAVSNPTQTAELASSSPSALCSSDAQDNASKEKSLF
jgi:hypothetical protein